MSARILTRRLGQSALAAFRPRSTYWMPSTNTHRDFGTSPWLQKDDAEKKEVEKKDSKKEIDFKNVPDRDPNDPLSNPLLERYLAKHDPTAEPKRPPAKLGILSESTIFKPEYEIPGWDDTLTPEQQDALKEKDKMRKKQMEVQRDYDLHALVLDPAPKTRRKFERKIVIKSLAKRGRITKAEKLMRTERQKLYRSPFLPTSVKKLTKIMNQIQGKTVEEALIQLRFSKKRVARDVLKGLQIARDEAIAARGMGLGSTDSELAAKEAGEPYLADGARRRPKAGEGVLIELKKGGKKVVYDPTEMYIDQAWVGRGEHGHSPEFRARGRVNLLTHRTTSFSVLLKEEKTRMRISDEIQKKRDNRKLWLPLPDRPVTSQRQYCLW